VASLRERRSGRTSVPEPDFLVGRSSRCGLLIDETYVSSQHAHIRWTGEGWEVKDLGSRNGTFLDGVQLKPGTSQPLRVGARLVFGHDEQEWLFADDTPPRAMVIPLKGGDPLLMEGDMLAVPSADDPRATLYRATDGRWVLERPDDAHVAIGNGWLFEVGGLPWRFVCPDVIPRTSATEQPSQISELRLEFGVTRDEEHVELRAYMGAGGQAIDLGSRAHNYLLLTLARQRLTEAQQGEPETSCGWFYQEDLANALGTNPNQLNIDIFRIRKQFAALGVVDAAGIIERRARTRQLRIGVPLLSVKVL
jgi:hypothetical protein